VCCYHSFPRPRQTLFGFTLATCISDWYASVNNLRGTPRGSQKKPNSARSLTGRLSTAVLCRGLEKNGIVGAGHGRGMASVNQTRPHCVNQIGKTHSKPLAARHGRGTACARHAMCESAFKITLLVITLCGPGCTNPRRQIAPESKFCTVVTIESMAQEDLVHVVCAGVFILRCYLPHKKQNDTHRME
jgi:hypothetical protein